VFCRGLFLLIVGLEAVSGFAPSSSSPVSLRGAGQRAICPKGRATAASPSRRPLAGLNMLGNLFGGKKVTAEEAGLIPEVYPAGTSIGSTQIRIKMASWVKAPVELGNIFSLGGTPTKGAGEIKIGDTITPTQTQEQPVLGWEAEKGALYTVIMTDPNPTPKDPSKGEWVHWIRCNIPGDNLPLDGKDGGDNVKEYVPSGPPQGTGEHKYYVMLYKQEGEVDVEDADRTPFTDSGRSGFKSPAFAEKYSLGDPVGFSYFKAEYDNYVLELYSNLKAGKR